MPDGLCGDDHATGRRLVRFRKGETIYYEGDVADTWFELTEGAARTCRFRADGHRQLTGFYYAGDVFGMEDQDRLESAEAITDLAAWRVLKPLSERADEAALGAQSDYNEALTRARDSVDERIFLFGRRTAPERLAAFIVLTANRLRMPTDVELPMCRTDIADHLGLTIHTVSRTFTQLCESGLISLVGSSSCRILDPVRVMALAGVER
jgi:CRP-like cAMP-binding protein